ncbi:MAG: hypothetical protein ACRYG8_04505 [Janthinobacterium lividum]
MNSHHVAAARCKRWVLAMLDRQAGLRVAPVPAQAPHWHRSTSPRSRDGVKKRRLWMMLTTIETLPP